MPVTVDRVGELMGTGGRNRRQLVSPEGVPLDIQIAGHGERLAAFMLDIVFMYAAITALFIIFALTFLSEQISEVQATVFLFMAFVIRNFYFLHFELFWQGRTPGKKICGLRVINRHGGELTPSAVIARNLTREVEFFLPFTLLLTLGFGDNALESLVLLCWVSAIGLLPLFNRGHLRAGDLIGGTQVISMPRRALLGDLAEQSQKQTASGGYTFNHKHLGIYGNFELQVLEEFLRRPESPESRLLLAEVCGKIRRKIGWEDEVPPDMVRRFLTEFYIAERAALEHRQLLGQVKEDKSSPPARDKRG